MPHLTPTRTPLPAIAVTVAVTALLAAGLAVQDVWLARSLETALAETGRRPAVRPATVPVPVAGSESFWLAPAQSDTLQPVSFAPVLPLGTRVALGAGGGLRQLEVVGVRALPADPSVGGQRLLVVTLHDVADRAAGPVRLVLDADAAARLAATPEVSDRAL
ncbi:MAG: hypothetical protein AB1749_10380 [Pseudomonadota bacterium]